MDDLRLASGLVLLLTFTLGVYLVSATSAINRRLVFHGFGPVANLVGGVSIFIHEMCHLFVAILFGFKIEKICLYGVWKPGKDAFVSFQYQPSSGWHRLGLIVSAWAPVIFPMTALVFLLPWVFENRTPIFLIGGFYLSVVLSLSMNLSKEDWTAAFRGLIFIGPALVIVGMIFGPAEGTTLIEWVPFLILARVLLWVLTIKTGMILILSLGNAIKERVFKNRVRAD